jgi:redox-sensitive bicupin YhaK (pirin superfamily)
MISAASSCAAPCPRRSARWSAPSSSSAGWARGEFLTLAGIDVRPHPHIGLSTVSCLFEGEILHRDSLGIEVPIAPGDVNWMMAGRGISHSERTAASRRAAPHRLSGILSRVALPKAQDEVAPDFAHHPGAMLPVIEDRGARLLLLGGAAKDGPRDLFWDFVSSSRARIEEAKQAWARDRMGFVVPGDGTEWTPLPERQVVRAEQSAPTG